MRPKHQGAPSPISAPPTFVAVLVIYFSVLLALS